MNTKIKDGGPAFPYRDDDDAGGFDQYTGMSLRDWFAGQPIVPNGHLECIGQCDDSDLLERYGTEEEKEQGFRMVFGLTNPQFRHTLAAVEVTGAAMPLANALLRQKLEARARAEMRFAEADAMLAARSKEAGK